MIVVQISDLHVMKAGQLAFGMIDTAECLRRCVATIQALAPAPDLVVATGDLVEAGTPEEYERLRDLLAPLGPKVLLLMGNHDRRAALRAAFPDHDYLRQLDEFVQYAVDVGPLRIVGLDSAVPGSSAGELCDVRLAWLDRTLAAAPGRPTLVLLHHPPFATGIEHMDRLGLAAPERLAAVVRRHAQVERVLCGHVHRSIQARFAGTVASVCPSPAHQLDMALTPGDRGGFTLEPPGLQVHVWTDAGLATHNKVIGGHPGPYPFGMGKRTA